MSASEIISRVKSNWALKIVFSVVFTVGFPSIYFGVLQRHPMFPVTTMRISWLDQLIPCVPGSVYLYESIFLLMPIAPWLTETKNELNRYCMGFALMSLVGFCIFFFFPTLNPRPKDIHGANCLYQALIQFDNGINACPSFHAAFTIFHGACCHATFSAGTWNKRIRWIIWIWVLGILASALLTKQHVFVDLVAGAILGVGGGAVFWFRTNGLSRQEERLHE